MNFQILQLETVNNNMKAYYDAWDKYIKAWIVIKINDPSCVYHWRLQVSCVKHYHTNHLGLRNLENYLVL